jgi:hypothetical protein
MNAKAALLKLGTMNSLRPKGRETELHSFFQYGELGLSLFSNRELVVNAMIEKTKSKIIVVLHGKILEENNTENRLKTTLDINLELENKINIKGENNSSVDGTDIIFDISKYSEEEISLKNVNLFVNSINIYQPKTKIIIKPEKLKFEENKEINLINNFIISSFNTRLKYKSNQIKFDEITGFDKKILEDKNLKDYYLLEKDLNNFEYSTKILSSFLSEDKKNYYAIVQENLDAHLDKKIISNQVIHKIILENKENKENKENNLKIIQDKIY